MSDEKKDNENANLPVEVKKSEEIVIPSKKEVIDSDNLIRGILDGSNTFELIDMVLAELAEDCAHLKHHRMQLDAKEEPSDRVILRHANILKMISDSLIQKRNLALNDIINLRSPQWQLVFKELMKKIKQTLFDINLTEEQLELFFEKFNKNLEGFEEQTEVKLKESLTSIG